VSTSAGYALRLSDDERARYRWMAQRAREREADLWELAGLRPGARVVDVGCGPGAVLAVLADVVGPGGRVVGVDADPEAVATARAGLAAAGLAGEVRRARAEATGLAEGTFDVAVLRHVLAHNGHGEQAVVDHLARLVRPGGHVYLLDVDATATSTTPSLPAAEDLDERYRRWHGERGNDLRVGRRLAALARAAGLEVLEYRGWFEIRSIPAGMRGPAWAAREALVAAGLAGPEDVDRWSAALAEMDTWATRPEVMLATFAAVARRPDEEDP
jgi:SAM-dependent methyltransferase